MNESSELLCPKCQRGDSLSLIEVVTILSPCERITAGGPDYSAEETETDPESVVDVGVCCECGWRYEGDDWMNHLSS